MPSVANEKGKVKCACEQWKLVPKYYPHYQTIMQLILGIFCCWHVSLNSLLQTCIIHRCVFFSPTEMFQNFGILYNFFSTELFSSEQCGATWIKCILVGVLELFGWLLGSPHRTKKLMFTRLHCEHKSYQLQPIVSGKVLALQQPYHDRITKMTWLMFILIFLFVCCCTCPVV